jgi:hypothetical protein
MHLRYERDYNPEIHEASRRHRRSRKRRTRQPTHDGLSKRPLPWVKITLLTWIVLSVAAIFFNKIFLRAAKLNPVTPADNMSRADLERAQQIRHSVK